MTDNSQTKTLAQPQPKWRHLKRGSIVTEIARGFAQVAVHPIEEMTAVVIYRHDADGLYWVRNAVEFDDGRFEPYDEPAAQPPAAPVETKTCPTCGRTSHPLEKACPDRWHSAHPAYQQSENRKLKAEVAALRIDNERLRKEQRDPIVWIAFADNGNVRFWTTDQQRAYDQKRRGLDLRAFTLAELVALVSHIPVQPQPTPEQVKDADFLAEYNSLAKANQAISLANKIDLHLTLSGASPGFHLSEDELQMAAAALRFAAVSSLSRPKRRPDESGDEYELRCGQVSSHQQGIEK